MKVNKKKREKKRARKQSKGKFSISTQKYSSLIAYIWIISVIYKYNIIKSII